MEMDKLEYLTPRHQNLNMRRRDARRDRCLKVATWVIIVIIWFAIIMATLWICKQLGFNTLPDRAVPTGFVEWERLDYVSGETGVDATVRRASF